MDIAKWASIVITLSVMIWTASAVWTKFEHRMEVQEYWTKFYHKLPCEP